MSELTIHHREWEKERKCTLDKVNQIMDEIAKSQGGKITIEFEIGCATTISYSVNNLYVGAYFEEEKK